MFIATEGKGEGRRSPFSRTLRAKLCHPRSFPSMYIYMGAMMGSNRADNAHRRMVPQDFHRLLPFSFRLLECCSPSRQTMKLDRSARIDCSILYDSLRSFNAAALHALLPLMMSISVRDERSHVRA